MHKHYFSPHAIPRQVHVALDIQVYRDGPYRLAAGPSSWKWARAIAPRAARVSKMPLMIRSGLPCDSTWQPAQRRTQGELDRLLVRREVNPLLDALSSEHQAHS
jgi:hypothetical protein